MMGFQDWLRTHEQAGSVHTYADPNPGERPGLWGITVADTVWSWEEDEGGCAPVRSFSTRADAENALYAWLMRGERRSLELRIVAGYLAPDQRMDIWAECAEPKANLFVVRAPYGDDQELASFDSRRECEAFILGYRSRWAT